MSIDNFPQHARTNKRNFSDEFMLPDHYPFKASIDEEIETLKMKYDFIIVDDEELIECRQMSKYTLSYGDAMDVLLAKKCKEYAGEQCWDEERGDPKFNIETALYSENKGKTFYFIGLDTPELNG